MNFRLITMDNFGGTEVSRLTRHNVCVACFLIEPRQFTLSEATADGPAGLVKALNEALWLVSLSVLAYPQLLGFMSWPIFFC